MAIDNQKDIENQLNALVKAGDQTNEKLVRLRALQSAADTYKSLRDNFMVRYTQAVQDQVVPDLRSPGGDAAAVPLRKSWPKAIIVLRRGRFLGLAMGFAIALLREGVWTTGSRFGGPGPQQPRPALPGHVAGAETAGMAGPQAGLRCRRVSGRLPPRR